MQSPSELREWLVGVLAECWREETSEPMPEWAARCIELPPEESIEHSGRYDVSVTPWVGWVMDWIQHRRNKELIVRKSSQSGLTLGLLIAIAWLVVHRPTHVLMALDSVPEVRKLSKARLKPLLMKWCGEAAAKLEQVDEDNLSNLYLQLRGMVVHLVGAFSAGPFANKSIGLVVLDELDLHPVGSNGGEASSLELARDRIKNVEQGMLVALSKPVLWEGPINQNYLTGSRHRLFVPCPHCGGMQVLRWEQMRFSHCKDLAGEWDTARLLRETYYECEVELCKGKIEEHLHKRTMLLQMEPRATNTGQDAHKPFPGRDSLHVSDLYSQFPSAAWGKLACEWVEAQGDYAKLRKFLNSRLGEAQRERKTETEEKQIHALSGGYEHGCLPWQPARDAQGRPAIGMFVDCQQDVKKWVKIGFKADGEAALINYGQTLSFEDLLVEADSPVRIGLRWEDGGPEERVFLGLIDEGYATGLVRDFVLTAGGRFWPCKGRGGLQVRDVVEPRSNCMHNGVPLTVYHFSDDDFKRELYKGRIGEFPRIKAGISPFKRLWLPQYLEDGFVKELCAERMVQERVRGRLVTKWAEPTGPNDFGDAVKMGLVWWYVVKGFFQPGPVLPAAAAAGKEAADGSARAS